MTSANVTITGMLYACTIVRKHAIEFRCSYQDRASQLPHAKLRSQDTAPQLTKITQLKEAGEHACALLKICWAQSLHKQ